MRMMMFVMPGLALMALAFWAYSENYATQAAIRELSRTRAEIARERETLAVLKAEWAYLNRPERLEDLAVMNFQRLELIPLAPTSFADPADIPRAHPPILLPGVEFAGVLDLEELP